MDEAMMPASTDLQATRGGALRTIAKIVAGLALLVLVADGVLSVVRGSDWLEWQRERSPRWYARIPEVLMRLPDPALRAMGGVQALASAAGIWRLR